MMFYINRNDVAGSASFPSTVLEGVQWRFRSGKYTIEIHQAKTRVTCTNLKNSQKDKTLEFTGQKKGIPPLSLTTMKCGVVVFFPVFGGYEVIGRT